jgi:Tol biopolymer transport system component
MTYGPVESRIDDVLRRLKDGDQPDPTFVNESLSSLLPLVGPGRTRNRPRLGRRHPAARLAALAAAAVLLIAIAMAALVLVGSRRPAPPFGPARAGYLAFDTPEGIVLARGDGTERHVLLPADGQVINPTWSRDGLQLAFWHRPDESGPWNLEVVDADGSDRRVLASGVSLRQREDVIGQPSNLSWSPGSDRIAYAGDVGNGTSIFIVDRDAFGAVKIVDEALQAMDPAWSPDGSTIAFQSDASRTLHVVRPDGSDEHQLSRLTGTELWPEWSPDGRSLATTAKVGDGYDIFTVSSDGSTVTKVSDAPDNEYAPSWSPDGKRLAWGLAIDQLTKGYVVVANADGSNNVVLPELADTAPPVWSPDGTRLYSYQLGFDAYFHDVVVLDPAGVAPAIQILAEANRGNGSWQRLP